MKQVFILFLLFYNYSFSQSPLSFSEVVHVDSTISKDELYSRARLFFANYFTDSKSVLEIQDKETGELSGKGIIKYNPTSYMGSDPIRGYITYKISILLKDGRYKYDITNFYHEGNKFATVAANFGLITNEDECPIVFPAYIGNNPKWKLRTWNDIKSQINSDILPLIDKLKAQMKIKSVKSSEW